MGISHPNCTSPTQHWCQSSLSALPHCTSTYHNSIPLLSKFQNGRNTGQIASSLRRVSETAIRLVPTPVLPFLCCQHSNCLPRITNGDCLAPEARGPKDRKHRREGRVREAQRGRGHLQARRTGATQAGQGRGRGDGDRKVGVHWQGDVSCDHLPLDQPSQMFSCVCAVGDLFANDECRLQVSGRRDRFVRYRKRSSASRVRSSRSRPAHRPRLRLRHHHLEQGLWLLEEACDPDDNLHSTGNLTVPAST